MKNTSNSSGNAAWAWATVMIVFIVFYFSRDSGRRARDSDKEDARSPIAQTQRIFELDSPPQGFREQLAREAREAADKLRKEAANLQKASARMQREQPMDRSQSFVESMHWLNRSMEVIGEKFNHLSKEGAESIDKDQLRKEIKEALNQVFVDSRNETPASQGEIDSPQDIVITLNAVDAASVVPPTPPSPPVANTLPETIDDGHSSQHRVVVIAGDRPILGEGVPDWIRQPITSESRILLPIESSMHSTIEECQEDLNGKLVDEAKRLLDMHVLQRVNADSIPELTPEFIREKLINREGEFDNFQERPSGTFHQLWVRMDIDEKELAQIRDWERTVVTQKRVTTLGGVAGGVLGALAGISGVVGLLSRREKNKKPTQGVA